MSEAFMVSKYWVDNIVKEEKKNPEPIVRSFLLQRSDTFRLTRLNWQVFSWFRFQKWGHDDDLNVIRVLNTLKEYFRKKIKSNRMDEKGKIKEFEYYFYDLDSDLKEIIDTETMVWNVLPQLPGDRFYGFEDPTFYKKNKIVGEVISHEGDIYLYLSDSEKKKLEAEGVELEKVE